MANTARADAMGRGERALRKAVATKEVRCVDVSRVGEWVAKSDASIPVWGSLY